MTVPPKPDTVPATPTRRNQPFRTEGKSLGSSLLADLDNTAEVLALAEGEDFH